MDVDGTLTDGKIYIGADGEVFKAFDVKDGYAIANMLPQMGIIPVIITGRESKIVEARCRELKITECRQGVADKLSAMREIAAKYGLQPDENDVYQEIAYIGDDIPDLECMRHCGFSACPADAADEIKSAVTYICKATAGHGAVRELVAVFSMKISPVEIPINKLAHIEGLEDIPDNTRIARYFTGEKLKKLVDDQNLWFSNADEFLDKKERTIPEGFFKNFKSESKENYQKLHEERNKYRKSYISCWTIYNEENYALWKIYDKDSDGACLITTFGKLKSALEKVRPDIVPAKVEYVDLNNDCNKYDLPWVIYDSAQMMPSVRMTEKFKQKPYKYEEEIRFIVYCVNDTKKFVKGFGVELDFASLIVEIVISPFSNEITEERTRRLLEKRFDGKIIHSSIIEES